MHPEGSPGQLRRALGASLQRLRTDHLDFYYLHRVDPDVPLEESVGAMSEFVTEGKIVAIGLSEVPIAMLDRAAAVHPIAAVESELSLWSRENLETIVPWCEANDAAFVPYAPLGRGFLTGAVTRTTSFEPRDMRASIPRFQGRALEANLVYVEVARAIATKYDATPAQVALAWLLTQSERILPIPGIEKIQYLEENVGAAFLGLDDGDLAALAKLPPAPGERYPSDLEQLSANDDMSELPSLSTRIAIGDESQALEAYSSRRCTARRRCRFALTLHFTDWSE